MAGRPAFEPTEDQRRLVRVLIAKGNTVEVIAEVIGIDRKTMRRHFRHEIAIGRNTVCASLGTVIVRAGLNGDWRAALAWLARFGGPEWQETQRRDVRTFDASQEDLSLLSDEEIDWRLDEIRRKRQLAGDLCAEDAARRGGGDSGTVH